MSGWNIVKFIEEGDLIEVVPSNWILDNKTECLWPPYTRGNLLTAIKSKETPNETWSTHKINLMTEKLYSKFVIATARATKAKFSSDISSGTETVIEKRTRPSKSYLNSSSSSEESDSNLPEFPDVPTKKLKQTHSSLKTINEEMSMEKILPDQSYIQAMPCASGSLKPSSVTSREHEISITPRQLFNSRPSTSTSDQTNMPEKPYRSNSRLSATPGSLMSMVTTPTVNKSRNDDEWKEQVIRKLVAINNRLKEQNKLFDQIMHFIENDQRNENLNNTGRDNNILKCFPVADDNIIEEVDELLQEENNFNILVNAMTRAGGDNVSEIVRRIMTRILTNEVAVLYSWHGHKRKKKFASLKLASVVLEAAKKNRNGGLITEKEIEIMGARWLTKAFDRMKKSNK